MLEAVSLGPSARLFCGGRERTLRL